MDVEFEFKEKNGGACVTKLLAPGAVCVVPESLGGLPVTELADKVFSGSTVEKVYLPRTLTRIGRYEFYGCEKLQEIHFYGALREVGGGVFTGCRNIRSLTVHMGVDEESALRDFVTEINERVTVHVFIQGGQKHGTGSPPVPRLSSPARNSARVPARSAEASVRSFRIACIPSYHTDLLLPDTYLCLPYSAFIPA